MVVPRRRPQNRWPASSPDSAYRRCCVETSSEPSPLLRDVYQSRRVLGRKNKGVGERQPRDAPQTEVRTYLQSRQSRHRRPYANRKAEAPCFCVERCPAFQGGARGPARQQAGGTINGTRCRRPSSRVSTPPDGGRMAKDTACAASLGSKVQQAATPGAGATRRARGRVNGWRVRMQRGQRCSADGLRVGGSKGACKKSRSLWPPGVELRFPRCVSDASARELR